MLALWAKWRFQTSHFYQIGLVAVDNPHVAFQVKSSGCPLDQLLGAVVASQLVVNRNLTMQDPFIVGIVEFPNQPLLPNWTCGCGKPTCCLPGQVQLPTGPTAGCCCGITTSG